MSHAGPGTNQVVTPMGHLQSQELFWPASSLPFSTSTELPRQSSSTPSLVFLRGSYRLLLLSFTSLFETKKKKRLVACDLKPRHQECTVEAIQGIGVRRLIRTLSWSGLFDSKSTYQPPGGSTYLEPPLALKKKGLIFLCKIQSS